MSHYLNGQAGATASANGAGPKPAQPQAKKPLSCGEQLRAAGRHPDQLPPPPKDAQKEAKREQERRVKAARRGQGEWLLFLGGPGDLVKVIEKDLKAVGVVGEEGNALLLYLVMTSRLLPEPASAVVRGPSGAGKSALVGKVAGLLPEEARVNMMRFTDAALFNDGNEDFFCHKIVIPGERKSAQDEAARDADMMLRQLISEKQITRSVSVKDPSAPTGWRTDRQVRKGPITVVDCTTGEVYKEDLNRRLQIWVDDSPKQNRDVMKAMAAKYQLPKEPQTGREAEEAVRRHHEFQRTLKVYRVAIPFAEALADMVPNQKPEVRRLFGQVLTVIESSVILHQLWRRKQEVEGEEWLVATPDDYALSRRLLLTSAEAALTADPHSVRRARDLQTKLHKAGVGPEFKQTDVQSVMGYKGRQGASLLLSQLVSAGMVEKLSDDRGNIPATYRMAPEMQEAVLPTADQLAQRVAATAPKLTSPLPPLTPQERAERRKEREAIDWMNNGGGRPY